jgi:hypothetical protein
MSNIATNVGRMTNEELIGLAKNRWIDEATQLAIIETGYRRARFYLAENTGIHTSTREELWSLSGYALKCELVISGHYDHDPDRIGQLYSDYGKQMRARSPWRMSRVFLEPARWANRYGAAPRSSTATPTRVLDDMVLREVRHWRDEVESSQISGHHHQYLSDRITRLLITHPNISVPSLVIISSSCPNHDHRASALKKLGNT